MGRPAANAVLSAIDRPRARAWAVWLTLALLCAAAGSALAAPAGKIQGRIVGTDNGEPIGFADVSLVPADTTLERVGGLTNADGTFLLEAAPGRYTLQIRALSYAVKRVEGIVLEAGALTTFNTALLPEAIQQEEVVVEGKARQNTETSMLAARKKAASVGDAVSAEQVRKSPDKDAAEVLRRVTGLSISDGKYVFVRGLGERYSSTEVDGVRLASPEQNKRVVPLDLVPANLLENIVVQKTYTADRPGEFGGGDVQVRTKDFPGNRTWSFSVSQGYAEGVTFRDHRTYASTRADVFGFGADSRSLPGAVFDAAGDRPLSSGQPPLGYPLATLASVAKAFRNVWSPTSARTLPNAGYSATYGDELRLFGRPLGLIESWSLSRSFDSQNESQRFYPSAADTLYDYAVQRSTESVQLGGLSGLSYRLSRRHTLHLRGLYTHSADDEVRIYEGPDHNRVEATSGAWLVHRNTRLLYVERNILSGTLEGQHEIPRLLGLDLDWKLTRSSARRLQPDRREVTYDRRYYFEGDVPHWVLGSNGSREYGDLEDNGWGASASGTLPYRLGRLGNGKVVLGFDRQSKARENFYRRLLFHPSRYDEAPPESLFDAGNNDNGTGDTVYVEELKVDDDNYRANQKVTAGYLSLDVPFGRRLRGTFGVRAERGAQDVQSHDLFDPGRITAQGRFEKTDWLPSGNLTWAVSDAINLRLAASRTLSRPDLNELSPSPALEYVGGFRQRGNPDLHRARIDNYDARIEAFPALSEVLAAGFFYKDLHQPIEQVIGADTPPDLKPDNSDRGHDVGVELEARSSLARLWSGLRGFSVNANASFISSAVRLEPQLSPLGSGEHPLQGQADYLVNGALSYGSSDGRMDASVLVTAVGRRLRVIGLKTIGDVYEQPSASLDATLNLAPFRHWRAKLAGRNLLDPRIRQLQGAREVSSFRAGRSVSIAVSYGS